MEFFNNLSPVTQVSALIIVLAVFYVHFVRFDATAASNGPAIFTTVGIFATFLGIALGLLHFDVSNIQGSVPSLLDGLKTAFWASVFGVGAALTVKIRYAFFGISPKFRKKQSVGATVDDLVDQLTRVQQALVGNDEATLISQLKLLRQENNDKLDALRKSQDAFMEKMADNNSKALIEALKDVMRDFNAKINEQFGENFKQLNKAVGDILVWQEQYRKQMSEMIDQQTQTAANMASATKDYGALVGKTDVFTTAAGRLETVLTAINEQSSRMEKSLEDLGKLLVAASGSLPEVEKRILEFAGQMTKSVQASSDEAAKSIKEIGASLQTAMTDSRKLMIEAIQSANQNLNSHITDMTAKTKEQVAALDLALEKEMTKSLEGLGRQLTALSQKFVEDYGPLTDRLRDVLRISAGV
jgi:phage-related tail protein